MNSAIRSYNFIFVAALLTACAAPKRPSPPPVVVPPPEPAPVLVEPPRPEVKLEVPPAPEPQHSDLDRLVLQFDSVRRMQGAEAAKELEQARQAFNRAKTDYNRIQLALLSLLSNTGGRDDAKAAALLEPMLKDAQKDKSGSGGLRAFAVLLYSQIAEEHKLEDRMKEEQKRADALQQKLDALKEVEKSLIEREQAQSKKK